MILYKPMRTHKLHRTILFVRVILSWKPFPYACGWVVMNNDAVTAAEI
jgi:hypothetical protein